MAADHLLLPLLQVNTLVKVKVNILAKVKGHEAVCQSTKAQHGGTDVLGQLRQLQQQEQ